MSQTTDKIRGALDAANLKWVTVAQDAGSDAVTLGGFVKNDNDKARAESIARPLAGSVNFVSNVQVDAKYRGNPNDPNYRGQTGNPNDPRYFDPNRPPQDAADDIKRQLTDGMLGHLSVMVAADTGIITLSGAVNAASDKARAEDIAKSIAGDVRSQITVTPTPR
jgi:osmotically-inducible protein OsmY